MHPYSTEFHYITKHTDFETAYYMLKWQVRYARKEVM